MHCLRRFGLPLGAVPTAWGSSSEAAEPVVGIRDYRFKSQVLRIEPGDVVHWLNREKRARHSILFAGSRALESERMFPNESWSRRFVAVVSYPCRCGPHPEISGGIEVLG